VLDAGLIQNRNKSAAVADGMHTSEPANDITATASDRATERPSEFLEPHGKPLSPVSSLDITPAGVKSWWWLSVAEC
jgi:hypothetical protein